MTDLEKLLKGKSIYRNEDKKSTADRWEAWADVFRFGTLGLLVVAMVALDSMPKDTAKVAVWFIAGFLFITATIGFVLGNIAIKHRMAYLRAEKNRVGAILDEAIEKVK